MFKINLKGVQEKVHLSEHAGLICAPRDIETMPELMAGLDEDEKTGLNLNEMAGLLANEVVQGWYGLCDEDGEEIAFDPSMVSAVMSDPFVLQAFQEQYFKRVIYLRNEGNGSSPSPNGTSEAGENTAKAVKGSARRAPTKPKSRKASKGAKSGG